MHQTANTDRPDVICNCCECCCVLLSPVLRYGMDQAISKSRFRASIDCELCTDCLVCLDRCQFGALGDVDGKVVAYQEKCFGCGQCVTVCPAEALAMVEARDPEHIPADQPGFSLSRVPVTTRPK